MHIRNEVFMIKIEHRGEFKLTKDFLQKAENVNEFYDIKTIDALAKEGCSALGAATPVDTGATASSWSYEIVESEGKIEVYWSNDNVIDGVNIAIILQYGHGTRNGGYVVGRDYINPALEPVFNRMTEDLWKAVVSK